MKKTFKAILAGNGTEYNFDTLEELREWASRATIVYGCDLSLRVIETVETEFRMSASHETGEVEVMA